MKEVSGTQGYVQGGYSYFFGGRKTGENKSATESLMEAIGKRKQEIYDKVRKGETETSIPIGAQSFTMRQWNKMMRSVDKAIDDMQERVRKDGEKQEQTVKVKKENSITTDMLAELLGIDIRKEKGLSEGEIYYQITGTERFKQDNALYKVEKGEEGMFSITDKTTGILYTNAQGVSYADENDPEKSWSLLFDKQSESNYDMIMEMMEEIIENGEDMRECQEWEKRLDKRMASYRKVEFDPFAQEFYILST